MQYGHRIMFLSSRRGDGVISLHSHKYSFLFPPKKKLSSGPPNLIAITERFWALIPKYLRIICFGFDRFVFIILIVPSNLVDYRLI